MKPHEVPTRAGRPGDPRRDDPIGPLPRKEGKVQARHLERLAVVYVRQSSPQQVQEHRESADLQYDLRRRATELGWPADRVAVIDEDQGRSGRTVAGRPGFQWLLAEVALDHVGIILGIEHQPAAGDPGVADRGVVVQLAAAGLVPRPGQHPAPEDVQLRLAHDPREPQQEAVVVVGRVVEPVLVGQQRAEDST